MPEADRGASATWTAADPEPRLVAHFEAIAERQPDAPAVVTPRGTFTFGALNAAANRLAHAILAGESRRGDRVALLMEAGPDLFAAMLGVLKTARICAILDPHEPAERLRQIVNDATPSLVIVDAASAAVASNIGVIATLSPDDTAKFPATNPDIRIEPDEIAFLVYTSGSTGRPKAVMKSHGHILLQPLTAGREMEIGPGDRVLMLAALTGGQGVNTAWVALARGATLVTFPAAERGITDLAYCIADNAITVFVSSAALFRTFAKTIDSDTTFPSVRVGTLAGDAATWQDFRAFRRHFPNGRMVTAFAASEAGYITLLSLDAEPAAGDGPLPVGRPCVDRTVRILDGDDSNPLPPGAVGLVEVGGRHLASGYWGDPALTARTFPTGPDGQRVFRSSDRGLLAADGSLVLKGRADAAIKIRGYRIDLGEVDEALSRLPGVRESAAVIAASSAGEPRLVAFVVPADPDSLSERSLRTAARAMMARHLVPSSFVLLDRLPITPNGKADRSKLRKIAANPPERSLDEAATDTERFLVRTWQEALSLEGLGRADDFFALGGDSLVAAEIAAKVYAELKARLDLGDFFDAPTLRDLAALIEARAAEQADDEEPIPRLPRDQPAPLSLSQQFLWRSAQSSRHAGRFNVGSLIELHGPLQRDTLTRALAHVISRHEPLRTRFPMIDGEGAQVIDPPAELALPFIDLSDRPDPAAEARRLLHDQVSAPFDIATAAPLRLLLLGLGQDRHALLRASHHIISDAPSWNTFVADLAEAYRAFTASREPVLPAIPFQYADYAAWQRKVWDRNGSRYRETIAWWKDQASAAAHQKAARARPPAMRKRPMKNEVPPEQSIIPWGLDRETGQRLDALAQSESTTYYASRLAVLVPPLAARSGSSSLMFRAYFTRRTRAEFEHTFGMFVDMAPAFLPSDPALTFREHLNRIRRTIAETSVHANIPFELIEEALQEDGIQLPNSPFLIHMPTQAPPVEAAGLTFCMDAGIRGSQPGIQFWFDQIREQDDGCATYFDFRIYEPGAVRALVDDVVRFARAAARSPDVPVRDVLRSAGLVSGAAA